MIPTSIFGTIAVLFIGTFVTVGLILLVLRAGKWLVSPAHKTDE